MVFDYFEAAPTTTSIVGNVVFDGTSPHTINPSGSKDSQNSEGENCVVIATSDLLMI